MTDRNWQGWHFGSNSVKPIPLIPACLLITLFFLVVVVVVAVGGLEFLQRGSGHVVIHVLLLLKAGCCSWWIERQGRI